MKEQRFSMFKGLCPVVIPGEWIADLEKVRFAALNGKQYVDFTGNGGKAYCFWVDQRGPSANACYSLVDPANVTWDGSRTYIEPYQTALLFGTSSKVIRLTAETKKEQKGLTEEERKVQDLLTRFAASELEAETCLDHCMDKPKELVRYSEQLRADIDACGYHIQKPGWHFVAVNDSGVSIEIDFLKQIEYLENIYAIAKERAEQG